MTGVGLRWDQLALFVTGKSVRVGGTYGVCYWVVRVVVGLVSAEDIE